MHIRLWALAAVACPVALAAQQPDSAQRDSLARHRDTLPEITVTATPTRPEDPNGTITITPKVIERTPALNPYDLLRQSAGLQVNDQSQGPGFASDATVRGFSSDHSTDIALWIDGVPNNEPVNGHAEGYNDWYLIVPSTVQSIDVIKGPTSALYGNFGLAGSLNLRTRERMQGTEFSLQGGSYGRGDLNILTGLDREHTGLVLAFRGMRDGGWRPNSHYDIGQFDGRLVQEVSPSTALDASVLVHLTGWRSPGYITVDQFNAGTFDTVSNETDQGYKNYGRERVSLRVITGSNSVWRSTVYATQGRWQLYLTTPPEGGGEEGTGSQTEEEDKRYGLGATTAMTWTTDRADLTIGAEGRYDHSDYQNWFTTNLARDSAQTLVGGTQVSGALLVQSSFQVGNPFRFSVGARYDYLDTRSTPDGSFEVSDWRAIFSPKLGALAQLNRAVGIYANVSRGFRSSDGVIEKPALPLITAWAYETGLKFNFRQGSASIALFRMNVSNEQTFDPITLASTSGGKSRRQGVEAEASVALAPVARLNLSATINDARYEQLITEEGDTLSGQRVFNTARFIGSAGLEVGPVTGRWYARAATNIVGDYTPFDEPGVEIPPYALVHLSGG
ncbi:MAG TPA: TonB-dependent receptor, partial [Gemmatimonadales bacterium]|nr:TonB-dependent receptor [Gemmatimonadales bacterium]